MQVFDFFTKRRPEELEPIEFTPTIQIHPNSTLFIECSPNDPHTASNIIINSYQSKTNRTNLQTRIQWKRFKIVSDNDHTNTNLPFITGNAYRCEPGDLGYFIQAKIISYDVACSGSAEVTIGPIRLDPTVKQLIEGAMYSKSLRSQIKVLDKGESKNVDMLLTDKTVKFIDEISSKVLELDYDISEPKIEINPKDPTKIFLRYERDDTNKVRQWLDSIFNVDTNFDTQTRSQGSSSSKNKIFKGINCINKVEIQYLTRHSRDQFIFSQRAFLAKEGMKNTAIIDTIENITDLRTPSNAHKFFQYISLKTEIYRLAELARELEFDRDSKLKDLQEVEETITETTTAYIQLLEKKGKEINIDFNQSYSEVSIRRDEILGKKQLRELQSENEQLKARIRELNEEIELKEFFNKKNNESQLFNQTSNPFGKKLNANDSYYNPSMANEVEEQLPKQSVVELTKSYVSLLKENEKLKQEKRSFGSNSNPNQSASKDDIVNLLESLHEEDEDPVIVIKKLKSEVKILKSTIEDLSSELSKKNKSQVSIRLNQSVAYQQQGDKKNQSSLNQDSLLNDSKEKGSFFSISQSNMNDSMTSEAGILLLEKKIQEINITNQKILGENERLRKERNEYRKLFEESKGKTNPQSNNDAKSFSNSNYFDPEGLKQQNEDLINEKNSLLKKIDSLLKEASKGGDSLLEKKCEELTKENNYLRKEKESLQQQIELLKKSNPSGSEVSENFKENDKLKKINTQLLEEIKNLKMEIQKKDNPLYNSRVIELENEVNYLKKTGEGSVSLMSEATQELLSRISSLQKEVERLSSDNSDKEAKLNSQTALIGRLMNPDDETQSINGKDKSQSESKNDSEATERLKKRVKDLQSEVAMLRASADVFNRSQELSNDMYNYSEEQLELIKKEKDMILNENERLSKMCERYAKDAREANKELDKWKKQAFELMKNQQHQIETN